MAELHAVIMAGGYGERFWPLSTKNKPKQLLDLIGGEPLIYQAVERIKSIINYDNILVITNLDLLEQTKSVLPQIPADNIIGEPIGRDTAAAIACASAIIKYKNPEAILAILTADQIIKDEILFCDTLCRAVDTASNEDVLVTIGIRPTFSATNFGYIQVDDIYEDKDEIIVYKAKSFVEKPDAATATEYLKKGSYFWNSGMFIWSVKSLEKGFKTHSPALYEFMSSMYEYIGSDKLIEGMNKLYPYVEKISIDYALMEKANNILMGCGEFIWDDVGSWPALENHFDQDHNKNTVIGDAQLLESSGNIIYSKNSLVAMIGLDDVIVVEHDGVILICKKDQSQDIKKLLNDLKSKKKSS